MASYENKDPLELAKQAEADLNSHAAKHGVASTSDSGILFSLFPSPSFFSHDPVPSRPVPAFIFTTHLSIPLHPYPTYFLPPGKLFSSRSLL